MLSFPNAKINLGLHITGKLPNGYHTIESCLYPIPWTDALEFVEAKKTSFHSSGINIPGSEKDNLVLKAYKLLKKDYHLPELEIHLHKAIPMGAGLGGGSADAAFMLKMLNEQYQLFLDNSVLEDYAAQLGSDCPFFIENKPALASGTGTDLKTLSLDLSGLQLIVVNPGIHISTQEAYAGVRPAPPETDLESLLTSVNLDTWRELLVNQFEESVFNKYPELKSIKDSFYSLGAGYASMSGSGSTIFGLFKEAVPLPETWKALPHLVTTL